MGLALCIPLQIHRSFEVHFASIFNMKQIARKARRWQHFPPIHPSIYLRNVRLLSTEDRTLQLLVLVQLSASQDDLSSTELSGPHTDSVKTCNSQGTMSATWRKERSTVETNEIMKTAAHRFESWCWRITNEARLRLLSHVLMLVLAQLVYGRP
jgi:hypothetical protein